MIQPPKIRLTFALAVAGLLIAPGAARAQTASPDFTGDGFRYTCTHSNKDRDAPLRFGFTSEDEMCIMFGYYYR